VVFAAMNGGVQAIPPFRVSRNGYSVEFERRREEGEVVVSSGCCSTLHTSVGL
jgi:hypothetical protein